MSVLRNVSRDELRKRLPGRRGRVERAAARGRRALAGLRTRAGRTSRDRLWSKRAGIAAAAAGAAGGAAAFFRDPERRGKLVSKALSPLKSVESPNDETIAERVRSEIFRPGDAPKGSVNVNVEQGVVYLRGEVADRERIQRLIGAAAGVPGVKRVESLLHGPGESPEGGQQPKATNGSRSGVHAAS